MYSIISILYYFYDVILKLHLFLYLFLIIFIRISTIRLHYADNLRIDYKGRHNSHVNSFAYF